MLYLGWTWKSKRSSLMRRLGCSSWGPTPHPLPRPFSRETWRAAVLGASAAQGAPGSAQSHGHQRSSLQGWMCNWAPRAGGVGRVAESAGQALGSRERRALRFCLLGAAQGSERPASSRPWTQQPACFPIVFVLICPAPGASGVCTESTVNSRLSLPVHACLNHLCVLV